MDKKKFIFTIDDNIRFFREISVNNLKSIFMHPYVKMLKNLHEKFGVKIQLNLFYEDDSFNLSQFPDKYFEEWKNNADWLKLSFHSKEENICPYEDASYEQVDNECEQVQREILRFAGCDSLAQTTTIHYCQTTKEGLNALKDNGIKGLLGLYGNEEEPQKSYLTPDKNCCAIRKGEIVHVGGMAFAGIDIILNCFSVAENLQQLQALKNRNIIKLMIHEQYFYEDYLHYQANFQEKIETAFCFLESQDFTSCFFEELI